MGRDRQRGFLQATLGVDGAKALEKALKSESFAAAIVPRTILSWVNLAARFDYEGPVPGVENTYFTFKKSENGGFNGGITIGKEMFKYQDASIYHVAGTVAVALGLPTARIPTETGTKTLQRLGKSIDTLVKARVAVQALNKGVLDPNAGYKLSHRLIDMGGGENLLHVQAHDSGGNLVGETVMSHKPEGLRPDDVEVHPEHRRRGLASAMYAHAERVSGRKVIPSTAQTPAGQALWAGNQQNPQFGKVELPGKAAPPKQTPQSPPTAPEFQPRMAPPPKPLAKPKSIKVAKSQADRACEACGGFNFRNERFEGCVCWADLAKTVSTVVHKNDYTLVFGPGTDLEFVQALAKTLWKQNDDLPEL